MDMDTDIDNTETRTDSPEINTISENDFKFIVSERRRGVTAKMYNAFKVFSPAPKFGHF